jgi:hypothetical protein
MGLSLAYPQVEYWCKKQRSTFCLIALHRRHRRKSWGLERIVESAQKADTRLAPFRLWATCSERAANAKLCESRLRLFGALPK